MRHRVGHALVSMFALLAVTTTAPAQGVVAHSSPITDSNVRQANSEGAYEDLNEGGEIHPVAHCTSCTFSDTMGTYEEGCCEENCGPLSKYKAHCRGRDTLGDLCRKCSLGNKFNNDTSACDSATCSSCYSMWDIEKRVYIGYVAGSSSGSSTRNAVGDMNGAQVGAEFLPYVCQDGSTFFTRLGFTVMWQYSALAGGDGTIESAATGGTISTSKGDVYSLILGPTYRADFNVLGVRFSPNTTMGITFDWINVQPTAAVGGLVKEVDRFKFTGFDAGFYGKWAFDIGITEKINLSLGMDYRASQTDVLQKSDNYRSYIGFIIGMSHTF